ncbi:MAG TPA: Wzz/FepE/Etk N-terminal domain-containing protein [Candidatus Acidoferrum sp.]|nr:Wzz/FepE/Etk N-terminal domain-containing protein [Candidatus Acidoferrum sp.]
MSTVQTEMDRGLDANEPQAAKQRLVARVRLLWEARKLLLITMLLGGLGSLGIALLIPARYEATTQLMPPEGQSGSGMAMLSALAGRAGGFGGAAGDLLGVKNSGALFVGILESRTVQDRLIAQFDLKRLYHTAKMEDTRAVLAVHTHISEDHKSGIIAVTVMDHDPRLAAALAQAYVDELDRLVEQVSTSSARRERVFLEERLRAVKQDLDNAARQFSIFASKNTAIDIPAQSKAMVEAAATLEGQLIAAEAELHGLAAMYTDQNVRVRSLRARVTELRAQLGKMGGESGTSAAPSSETDASLYPAIRQLPLLGVTYADLYRQTKIQETVYELLTQQYELAKVQEAKEVPSVKVLDAAVVPTKKSFPPRGLLTVAGTGFAVLAVCVWILVWQAWQEIDPQDPGKKFAEEVAGTLHAGALRAAPAAAAFVQSLARRILRPKALHKKQSVSAEEKSTDASDLVHAARNGMG